jgi:hypothetical protein
LYGRPAQRGSGGCFGPFRAPAPETTAPDNPFQQKNEEKRILSEYLTIRSKAYDQNS